MANSGTITMTMASTERKVITRSVIRRPRLTLSICPEFGVPMAKLGARLGTGSGMAPRRLPFRHRPNQELGKGVHNDGHEEQREADFDEGAGVEVSGRFAKFVGDYRGHGVTRGKQGSRDLWPVADHHGDSHGFTQCAAQTQDDGSHDTRSSVA